MIEPSDTVRCFAAPAAALLATAVAAAGPAGTSYTLVPTKSSLTYAFTQAGAINEGSFRSFSVRFDPVRDRLSVVIDMRSFDTGDPQRNDILGGPDMFDVAQYPEARFTSTRIERTRSGFAAVGALTIRGVTHSAIVPFTWRTGPASASEVGYLTGQITLLRLDYGIGDGQWKSTDWVGNQVTVRYSLQLEAK